MEPNSREFYKQCAFQKFCNTVLHNEACDAQDVYKRQNRDREIRKPRPSIRAQLKADKAKTAPKKACLLYTSRCV